MRLPNLLASKRGRLAAFFALYVTEGIPLGFTATAVATQMRRQGVGPGAISVFVGMLYLPWAWKWLIGPIVDVVYSERLGRRRAWIVAAQGLMALTLLATVGVDYAADIGLFTAIVLVVNIFGATQDVAIDALACSVLREEERGLANGLMFAGAYAGNALGGAGVLFLTHFVPFNRTFFFVAGSILAVTVGAALFLHEPKTADTIARQGTGLFAVTAQIREYARQALKAFFGTRAAVAGLVFALLPAGAYSLSLALQSNLAVELGLTDSQIGLLSLLSAVLAALGCVVGGYLSDRFGRRRMLALYVVGTVIPTAAFAYVMYRHGWIMPIDPQSAARPASSDAVITAFWALGFVYSIFQGLMYGTRTALFMDICTPTVAATQFTAYMAVLNVVIWYSGMWQGWTIESLGYPATLAIDSGAGLLCLLALPWASRLRQAPRGDESAT